MTKKKMHDESVSTVFEEIHPAANARATAKLPPANTRMMTAKKVKMIRAEGFRINN